MTLDNNRILYAMIPTSAFPTFVHFHRLLSNLDLLYFLKSIVVVLLSTF